MTSLKNRFKEFRRTPVQKANKPVAARKSPKKKKPGITQVPSQPSIVCSEDDTSFKRNIARLKVEYNKTRRNESIVTDLMDRTFPKRRKAIMDSPTSVSVIFEQFPFLQESNQVYAGVHEHGRGEGGCKGPSPPLKYSLDGIIMVGPVQTYRYMSCTMGFPDAHVACII